MDKFVEASLVFIPQVIFIFLVGGFIKQDISSLFYLPRYEEPKSFRFSNHLFLYIGVLLVSMVILPYSIVEYVNGTVVDFYDVLVLLLAADGILFLALALFSRLYRNVVYNKGIIIHKNFLKSVAFDIEKIEDIKIVKGLFFSDVEFHAQSRKITINSFCSNLNTLLLILAKRNNEAVNKEVLTELYDSNNIYKKELETLNIILEVINND
jgi:hypothetical protein